MKQRALQLIALCVLTAALAVLVVDVSTFVSTWTSSFLVPAADDPADLSGGEPPGARSARSETAEDDPELIDLDDGGSPPSGEATAAAAAPAPDEAGDAEGPDPALDPRRKLSPPLLRMIDEGSLSPSTPVRVILQAYILWRNKSGVADVVRSHDGSVRRDLRSVNGYAAELPLGSLLEVAASPEVWRISPDEVVSSCLDVSAPAVGADLVWPAAPGASGFDGSGVGICVIDTGCGGSMPAFARADGRNRVVLRRDFTTDGLLDDGHGHGTHVSGVSASSDPAYSGIAPGASVIALRVLDASGSGYTSDVIAAIDWAIANRSAANVRVINMSLGHPVSESSLTDPLAQACARAVDGGIVVVASAGNNGSSGGKTVYGGISSPGHAPWVVTVGATNTRGTVPRSDDEVAWFSSRGPTAVDGLLKPDLVAPGQNVVSLLSPGSWIAESYPELVVPAPSGAASDAFLRLSGTSMAAPVVAGTVALMLQANPSLTPNSVKAVLMYTAERMTGPSPLDQGAGCLNAEGAVRLAAAIDAAAPAGSKWIRRKLEPVSTIAAERILWGSTLVWGRHVIWGRNVRSDRAPSVWNGGAAWPDAIVWRPTTAWNDPLIGSSQSVYGEGVVWRRASADSSGSSVESQAVMWRNVGAQMFGPELGTTGDLVFDTPLESLWSGSMVDPDSLGALGVLMSDEPTTDFEVGPPGSWFYPNREMDN